MESSKSFPMAMTSHCRALYQCCGSVVVIGSDVKATVALIKDYGVFCELISWVLRFYT